MKAFLVDDETGVRQALRGLLNLWCPEIETIEEADSVGAALHWFDHNSTDLLFLDVELGDGTGFDILRKLPRRDFNVIFATAHEHYAIDAIRFSATDFLLKPIDPDDLMGAVARAAIQNPTFTSRTVDVMLSHQQGAKDRIVLRDTENIYVLNVKDIIRCEADGRYTRFFLTDRPNPIMVSTNLKEYELMLASAEFVRVHHSHLVNLAHVQKIDKANLNIHLTLGHSVPISVRKKDEIMHRF